MHLDVPTLGMVGFLIGIVLALGFSALAVLLPDERAPRWWAVNFWLGTLGALMGALRGHGSDAAPVMIGNLCFVIANACILMGLARHVRSPLHWRGPALFCVIFLLAVAWFQVVDHDLRTRLMIFSAQVILWDVWIMVVLLRFAAADVRRSARFTLFVFAVDAVYNASRIFTLAGADPGALPEHGQALATGYLFGILIALAQSLAFILLMAERLVAALRRQARIDGLTGLLNRDAILEEGAQLLNACADNEQRCTLLMFDLDYFKRINDSYGHAAGDAVLRHFAARIQSANLPSGHRFARYGGEEFLLLLPAVDASHGMRIAERLRQGVASIPERSTAIAMTTSIGIAEAMPDDNLDDLIVRADAALYRAKANGRNACVSWQAELDNQQAPRASAVIEAWRPGTQSP